MSFLAYSCIPLRQKIKWTLEEDRNLTRAVSRFGTGSWVAVAGQVPGRTSKQCRERWLGQLAPSVVKSSWTPDEDRLLLSGHSVHGNQWSIIARSLPGRSAISVKNRWGWLLRHGVPQRYDGVSPFTHTKKPEVVSGQLPATAHPLCLDPIGMQDPLFGAGFREFQANMLGWQPVGQ
jgi:hypothetical protein